MSLLPQHVAGAKLDTGDRVLLSTGADQHLAGVKLDTDKPDASLLLQFSRALMEVSKVGTFGVKKYSRGGWLEVDEGQRRYTAAMIRHLLEEDKGPMDLDSGMYHAAQVAWNALARLELLLREERGPTQL